MKLFLRHDQPFAAVGNDILRWFADHRGDTIVSVSKALNALTGVAVVFATRLLIVLVLGLFARWRHLVIALAAFVVGDFLVSVVLSIGRPPPAVPVLVSDTSYHFPSRAVASLGITLFVAAAVLLPGGRPRFLGRVAAAVAITTVVLAQAVLAADYPSDAAYAAVARRATPVPRAPTRHWAQRAGTRRLDARPPAVARLRS